MATTDEHYIIVLVTVPNEELGAHISWQVVSDNLAACVNRIPIRSTYRWGGEIHNDQEELLVMKTTMSMFERLRDCVLALHTYEVPEVVAFPIIAGHAPYLEWISGSVIKEG